MAIVASRMDRSDGELVEACVRGEQQAWQELVARYSRLVYSIPRSKGFSTEDTDDVFQNVFTIVYRQLPSLRRLESLTAWLITITQRQCYRQLHRTSEQAQLYDNGDVPDASDDPVQLWEQQELIAQAMARLEPRCRELLSALFLAEHEEGYKDIAVRLGVPIGSIGPTRARCFKKLEAILRALGVDGVA